MPGHTIHPPAPAPFARFPWLAVCVVGALLVAAPLLLGKTTMSQLTFVLISAIAGYGMQILVGFTGQISLGHAVFLAIGAYGCGYLEKVGVPFVLALPVAGVLASVVGVVVARPALRLTGIYFITATIAFGLIGEELATRWTSVTGGNSGMVFGALDLFGLRLDEPLKVHGIAIVFVGIAYALAFNTLRTPLGRSLLAVRDSEVAAHSMGVDVARAKTIAFAVSAALCAVSGALYAHALGYIDPGQFTLHTSLELLILLIVGGLHSLRGVMFGAVFIVALPDALRVALRLAGHDGGAVVGLQPLVEGLILVVLLLFEPKGIDGLVTRWLPRRRLAAIKPRGEPPPQATP